MQATCSSRADRGCSWPALATRLDQYQDDEELVRKVGEIAREAISENAGEHVVNVDVLPPFLPYLLSHEPKNPMDLLDRALAIRDEPPVKDLRAWRNELVGVWRDQGRISTEARDKIGRPAQRTIDDLKMADKALDVTLKATLFGFEASAAPPKAEVHGPQIAVEGVHLPVRRLWAWALDHLPGRRHNKLVLRMAPAQNEYEDLSRHLLTVWKGC